jgi:prepilin-type N-terminal cleavage/methylation domain-containing protein/prepilin-type processing-associated H-X9-DG protein
MNLTNPLCGTDPSSSGTARGNCLRAFTLVELLVVIAILILLASTQLPALAKARHHTDVSQCAANLRQVTMAYHIYGTENNDHLPAATAGYWAWDMPWNLATTLSGYGAPRNALYCPANSGQNVDGLWNAAPGSYRTIGYALTLPGGGSISPTNWNPTLTPQAIPYGPVIMRPPLVSQRVLVADATLSQPGQDNEANRATYNYTTLAGGSYPRAPATSHLDRFLPAGGNLGMLDGHVEWRVFQQMHVRTPPGSGTPVFWW